MARIPSHRWTSEGIPERSTEGSTGLSEGHEECSHKGGICICKSQAASSGIGGNLDCQEIFDCIERAAFECKAYGTYVDAKGPFLFANCSFHYYPPNL
ncbi:hypothetical protein CLOSCI_01347 [[Clostridium] scindens ATCC 35704]|nr:hypothetical protein CLOSCI_01347 [[Clostridium] scindens ATCC 35704]